MKRKHWLLWIAAVAAAGIVVVQLDLVSDAMTGALRGKVFFPRPKPGTQGVGVTAIALSPDGATLAEADQIFDLNAPQRNQPRSGELVMVRLRDAKTGIVKRTIMEARPTLFEGLSFSRDGRTLASASEDETVMLWDVRTMKATRVSE